MAQPRVKQINGLQSLLDNQQQIGRLSMAGPIKQVIVETATNIIDITGLDLSTDGEYRIVVSAESGDAGTTNYSLYVGDPTLDETAANYDSTRVVDGSSAVYSDAVFASLNASGEALLAEMLISQDVNDRLRVTIHGNQDTPPNNLQGSIRSVNAFGDITKIRIKASQSNGFAVGIRNRFSRQ
jgi:hypothetical protein